MCPSQLGIKGTKVVSSSDAFTPTLYERGVHTPPHCCKDLKTRGLQIATVVSR